MTDEQKKKTINEILAKMNVLWNNSHRYLTEDDFAEMLKVYERLCKKRGKAYANDVWEKCYQLPMDFKFKQGMPITPEIWVQLNPDISSQWENPNLDVHFALTADEIISRRVPGRVCTCGGVAKVFCKFAIEANLDCVEVQTVNVTNQEYGKLAGGHQIMAVRLGGKLVPFDPGDKEFKSLDEQTEIKVGNWIQSISHDKDPSAKKYLIINIVKPQEHLNVKCNTDEYNPASIQKALRIAKKKDLESGCKTLVSSMTPKFTKHFHGNENE